MTNTILIVEDNELNLKLFNDLLEGNGYKTIQARTGEEGYELARQHKPDLIVMDIQLPDVSGVEITQRIKKDEDLKSIPIIAITAYAMKGDEERIREGGCEEYMSKPIALNSFLEVIRTHIGEN